MSDRDYDQLIQSHYENNDLTQEEKNLLDDFLSWMNAYSIDLRDYSNLELIEKYEMWKKCHE